MNLKVYITSIIPIFPFLKPIIMKPGILSFLFLILVQFAIAQSIDIKKVKQNLLYDALENQGYRPTVERYIVSDYSKSKHYLKTMKYDGSWADVDYADRDNDWHPLHHLDRLLVMSWNYRKKGTKLFENKKLNSGIEKAIAYWYKTNPECDNWYKNRIAKQFYFNVIALLLDGEINRELHKKMVNDLTENPTMTGSNRTLLAISTFYKGVLENNAEKVKLGVSGVTDQIVVTTDEGVQPDYSFHQHGHFIYNGSYGLNFLRESSWLAQIVQGTEFAFSEKYLKILRDYYFEGTRRMLRGGLIDYNVRGRQVGRPDAMKLSAGLLIPILTHLSQADTGYADEYQQSIELIRKQLPQKTAGNKHFWRSDYTIHHRKNYSTSLKMCSERIKGIELNMNTENKLGYWLPYGLTYIYRHGIEYDSIFPVWDWARLPGVTNPYIEIEETEKGKSYTQETSFVGGVSNGKYGISAMDFSQNQTKAKKAWFWFDNEFAALGSGIKSEHDSAIVTGINQCILKEKPWINNQIFEENRSSFENPGWIFHDSIGYIFPENETVEIKAENQEGNMQRIFGLGSDSLFSKPVFSLWINHGVKPVNESYQYIVVPGKGKSFIQNYAQKIPVYTLLNTTQVQAVYHKNLQITGIVFYEKGEFEFEGLSIEVNEPCLVLLDEKSLTVSVSEPTTKETELQLKIFKPEKYRLEKTIELPQGGCAGKSVTLNLNQ